MTQEETEQDTKYKACLLNAATARSCTVGAQSFVDYEWSQVVLPHVLSHPTHSPVYDCQEGSGCIHCQTEIGSEKKRKKDRNIRTPRVEKICYK